MSDLGRAMLQLASRALRRHLVGGDQHWVFERTPADWRPPRLESTSLYLHVPFCRNCCPYCPYTKVPYAAEQIEPFTRAALREVDRWADGVGPAEVTSIYIGGGTPTLALDAVETIVARVRKRFRLTGDVCIETSPTDVDARCVARLREIGVALVSLGVQSFRAESLQVIGRRYDPATAERALGLLANGGFAAVNADIMFALPGQAADEVVSDLDRAANLGADQLTTYPLFTFPYTEVGEYLRLKGVRMPDVRQRRAHYRAIAAWSARHGFDRVSVWGFRRGTAPRYSSVTRDGYIGIGPGSGSHLPDGFTLNTFDLGEWMAALELGRSPIALRMPFAGEMGGWWWLYWRFYDTRIPLGALDAAMGVDAAKARRWLRLATGSGFARRADSALELTDSGAFWLHLAQNHLALSYVNTLWTAGKKDAWPERVSL